METKTPTIEELTQQLAANRDLMQNKASEYVVAYNSRFENRTSDSMLRDMKSVAQKAVKDYNSTLEHLTYMMWAEEGDMVRTALRTYYIPNAQTVTFPEDKNTGIVSAMFKPVDVRVNLMTAAQVCGNEVFANDRWFDRVQALGNIIADDLHSEINPHSPFHYDVTSAAREFGFKYTDDMTKREKSIAALQQTIDSILFIPTKADPAKNRIGADGPAWSFVRECMTGHGPKTGQVIILPPCRMCELIAEAMHVYITNGMISLICG